MISIIIRLKSFEREHLIIKYINEYCSESLTKFECRTNPKGGLNNLTETFNKFEKIEMMNSYLTEKTLHELFPKIFELKLDYRVEETVDMLSYNKFIAYNLPHLDHLQFDVYDIHKINKENVAIALRSNPQLKSLKGEIWLDVIFDKNYFRNGNEIL